MAEEEDEEEEDEEDEEDETEEDEEDEEKETGPDTPAVDPSPAEEGEVSGDEVADLGALLYCVFRAWKGGDEDCVSSACMLCVAWFNGWCRRVGDAGLKEKQSRQKLREARREQKRLEREERRELRLAERKELRRQQLQRRKRAEQCVYVPQEVFRCCECVTMLKVKSVRPKVQSCFLLLTRYYFYKLAPYRSRIATTILEEFRNPFVDHRGHMTAPTEEQRY